MRVRAVLVLFGIVLLISLSVSGSGATLQSARVKDLSTIEGIRENSLIGYGLVVGLNGRGDSQQTVFSTQTLANMLQRMGVQVPAASVRVNNIAAVFVTANLPAFARPGMLVDATVSSAGDAKSIEGGLLLLTRLYGANGQVYATAQGPVTVGGYSAGGIGTTRTLNHPTAGRIPSGATVEQPAPLDLRNLHTLSFLLREPDFATARDLAAAINNEFKIDIARAVDSRRVEVAAPQNPESVPGMLARIEELVVPVHPAARVVINERTGTIVIGRDVKLGAVSILHGNLVIDVSTTFQVSQPSPFSKTAETKVVPQVSVKSAESAARRIELKEGATVEDLVRGLQAIGATARDVVSILQAIQKAGALQAELDVI
jgi:flagellar P-ring protein precursor FlgI